MQVRRFQLELSPPAQPWHARLTPLPGSTEPAPGAADPPGGAEFDSPLALLEWLERDLPPDPDPPGLL